MSILSNEHDIQTIIMSLGLTHSLFAYFERQHLPLHRDLEIVMVNGMMPWGNCHLVPVGPLREPLIALSRADIVVIHHANLVYIIVFFFIRLFSFTWMPFLFWGIEQKK